jgi:tripeptide aminopeptidase
VLASTTPETASGLSTQAVLIERVLRIAQTPAPTFHEGERSSLIAGWWASFGLHPELDAAGNVIARIGRQAGASNKRICLAAHLDTVFEAGTDLKVRYEGNHLVGPGIGDNASSLAVLTTFAERLAVEGAPCELWLAATTGEEGLGDLKGAKHLLNAHAREFDAFIAVDGYLGLVVDRSVGVRRYRVSFHTEGGHSWGNAGAPSAIQALGDAIHDLYKIPLVQDPRATLNVGTVSGGTSVNSIASSAEMLLDLRSIDASTLEHLEDNARSVLTRAARRARAELRLTPVGDRPAGETDNQALVRASQQALEGVKLGMRRVASSTDANAAVPHHLPAIAFGVYRGGNAHRLDEWIEPESLEPGLLALEGLVHLLARS